mgnify:FL=1
MGKVIRNIFKSEKISLSECTDGFFLFDFVRGQNISIRAKNEKSAFIEAILWYQKRLTDSQLKYRELNNKVNGFISQFNDDDN